MKKASLVLLAFILLTVGYVYLNKLYYPPVPFESLHKKELVAKGKEAVNELVFVTSENDYDWYIVNMDSSQTTGELIQQVAAEHDWQFIEQLGSGYLFEKNDKQLIITATMWSRNFQLVKVTANTLK